MLLWLLDYLARSSPYDFASGELAGWDKITFRASLAAIVGFALAVMLGPRLIGWLRLRFREPIKGDSPRLCRMHREKEATPTMG
ncbi:MAG: phospho-N-acetylmuramoyl-pentapeptide-transferase, partial [Planctomycetes bacterium]|nr:phospho-N-acetylmuramoyl-pentapeptide-transferase [Planctomycetota bacterium]